jgi:secreted PhoX family phosphatase
VSQVEGTSAAMTISSMPCPVGNMTVGECILPDAKAMIVNIQEDESLTDGDVAQPSTSDAGLDVSKN